jgi:hypothetical protein
MSSRMLASLLALGLTVTPFADAEAGVAFVGYDDVQIPRDGGTRFSLKTDVPASPAPYFRARVGATLGRSTVFATAAPLRIGAEGTPRADVRFAGATFPAGQPIRAEYRFDSYRVTWRWSFLEPGRWEAALGATGFVRDASVRLAGPGGVAKKDDLGFVPLVSFRAGWWATERLGLVLDGDAIAGAGPGRAEDVQLAVLWRPRPDVAVRVGWRVIEGGADVKAVYNFALVHLVGAGITVAL